MILFFQTMPKFKKNTMNEKDFGYVTQIRKKSSFFDPKKQITTFN